MSNSECGRYAGYQVGHGAAEQKPFGLGSRLPRPKQAPDDFGLGVAPRDRITYCSAHNVVGHQSHFQPVFPKEGFRLAGPMQRSDKALLHLGNRHT